MAPPSRGGRGGGRGGGGGGGRRGGGGGANNAPRTIYQMLLWLYWLGKGTNNTAQAGDQVIHYKTTLKNYIDKLRTELLGKHPRASGIHSVTESAKGLVDKVCEEAGKILVTIQKGVQYNSGTHQGELAGLEGEAKTFTYPTDNNGKDLYDCFVYYVTACYWQLSFLCQMCNVESTNGGWKACQYGKTQPLESDQCKTNDRQNHSNRCKTCSKNSGCLQVFLTATQWQDGKTSEKNIYNGAEYNGDCTGQGAKKPPASTKCYIQPMGFDKENHLPVVLKGGKDLHNNLKSYFDDEQHTKPFPKLLGHLKLLELLGASSTSTGTSPKFSVPQSWIAGDLWAFWYQLNRNEGLKNKLKESVKVQYPNGFKKHGSQQNDKPDFQDLDAVFKNLLFAAHGNNNNDHNSLVSLSDCEQTNSSNKCGKYLYGLLSDPFYWVLDWFKENIELLTFEVLKELARELKQKLSNFKGGLEKKDKSHACAKEKSCRCIVWCDDTHTVIYRYGFRLHSPESLDSKKRKCSDLKDQLELVTADNSALDVFSKLVKYDPPQPPPVPKTGNDGRARSESTDSSPAKPVAAKPEAPKPQGAKPAATKPAASKPVAAPSASGAGGDNGSGGPTAPVKDAKGASSSSGSPPPPPPPPPPAAQPPAGGNNAVTPAVTAPNGSGGAGRSADTGGLKVTLTSGAPQAVAQVSGPQAQAQAQQAARSAASSSSPLGTTSTTPTSTTTPSSTSSPGSGSTSPKGSTNSSGTVKITDNKDGADTWMKAFGTVLDQLKEVFTKVSKSTLNLTSKVSTSVLNTLSVHLRKPLTSPPQSVKECIEWILCCEEYGGAQKLEKAINTLLGSDSKVSASVISELIKSLKSLLGLNDNSLTQFTGNGIITNGNNSYNWTFSPQKYMFKNCNDFRISGVPCCKDKDCSLCSQDSCCPQCQTLDQCRIFLLIIPVLRSVLKYLSSQCHTRRSWSLHSISDSTKQLCKFILQCGFAAKDLTPGLQGKLLWSNLTSAVQDMLCIHNAVYECLSRCDMALFPCVVSQTLHGATLNFPGNISELLVWLFLLPYCSKLKSVLEGLNSILGIDLSQDPTVLREALASIPMLMFAIDGCFLVSIFRAVGMLTGGQCSSPGCLDGENILPRILISTFPVLFWSLQELKAQCRQRDCNNFQHCRAWQVLEMLGWAGDCRAQCGTEKTTTTLCMLPCAILRDHLEQNICGQTNGKFHKLKVTLYSRRTDAPKSDHSAPDASHSVWYPPVPRTMRETFVFLLCFPASGLMESIQLSFMRDIDECKEKTAERFAGTDPCTFTNEIVDTNFRIPSVFWTVDRSFTSLLGDIYSYCCRAVESVPSSLDQHITHKDYNACDVLCAVIYVMYCFLCYLKERSVEQNVKSHSTGHNYKCCSVFLKLMGFDGEQLQLTCEALYDVLQQCFPVSKAKSTDICICDPGATMLFQCAFLPFRAIAMVSGQRTSSVKTHTDSIRSRSLWLICLPLTECFFNKDNGITLNINDFKEQYSEAYKSGIIKDLNGDHFKRLLHAVACNLWAAVTMIEGNILGIIEFLSLRGSDFGFHNAFSATFAQEAEVEHLHVLSGYAYDCCVALRFLLRQCSLDPSLGGWSACHFGSGTAGHTTRDLKAQLSLVCTCAASQCRRPLKGFLTQNGGPDKNMDDFPSCAIGFRTFTNPYNIEVTGRDLWCVLSGLVDGFSSESRRVPQGARRSQPGALFPKPLTRVTQLLVGLAHRQPHTLGETIDVFCQLDPGCKDASLWERAKKGSTLKEKLDKELQDALHAVNVSEERHGKRLRDTFALIFKVRHNDRLRPKDPDPHSALTGLCDGISELHCSMPKSTCGPYMLPLSQGLFALYLPDDAARPRDSSSPLQFLYDMCYKLLRGFQLIMSVLPVDSDYILRCRFTHRLLLSHGVTFGNPRTLSEKNITCIDLKQQLQRVTSTGSVLYSLFISLVSIVHCVLLHAGIGTIDRLTPSVQFDPLLREHFECYLRRAFHEAFPILICQYVCKVFDSEHDCNDCHCKKDHICPTALPAPMSAAASTELRVTESRTYRTIKDHFEKFKPPAIDMYHVDDTFSILASQRSFVSAFDFFICGSHFLKPPRGVRQCIDWILCLTRGPVTGNCKPEQSTDVCNACRLSGGVDDIFAKSSGLIADEQKTAPGMSAVVTGLRVLMGYKEVDEELREEIAPALSRARDTLNTEIQHLTSLVTRKEDFAKELCAALGKSMFDIKGQKKNISDVCKEFISHVNESHQCQTGTLDCSKFSDEPLQPEASQGLTDGLCALDTLFRCVELLCDHYSTVKNTMYSKYGGIFSEAHGVLSFTAPGLTGQVFFDRVHGFLSELSACSLQLEQFSNGKHIGGTLQLKTKLQQLIGALERCIWTLTYTYHDGNEEKDRRLYPDWCVSACAILMTETKRRVESYITDELRKKIESTYKGEQFLDTAHSADERLCISDLKLVLSELLLKELDRFKSHLDDLRSLCHCLQRLGGLMDYGLVDFVIALLVHLNRVLTLIKSMEALHLNMIAFNANGSGADGLDHYKAAQRFISEVLKYRPYMEPKRIVYLEAVRPLVSDRYVSQLWHDNKDAIKNWSVFKDGIIRHSDLSAIKQKLHDLTRISYSSTTATGSSSPTTAYSLTHRIHNFHAICVIQKFSFEAPIIRLERSLEELEKIKDKLEGVKGKCNGSTSDVSTDDTIIKPFCTDVSKFLQDPYGIFSFAKFVHTILGPNVFSAVIGALEELKDTEKYKPKTENGGDGNLERIKGILGVMTVGLDGENNKDHYTLTYICDKLQEFITTLKREYIFSYPVVCGIKSEEDCKKVCDKKCDTECDRKCSVQPKDTSLACSSQSSLTPSLTSATSTVSLTSLPLLFTHCHTTASICPCCVPLLAKMFITLVPVLYPQLCYLAYQCRLYWCARPVRLLSTDKSNKKELSSLLQTFGYDNDILQVSSSGLYFIGDNVWSLLCNERNSLRLLCQDFTEEYNVSPFNTESPLFKLYHLCLAYYQRRKNERLTHTSSTTPVMPTTLREILRFFVYLPFSAQFESFQEVLRSYCSQSCVVNFSDLFASLMMSSAMSAVLLQLIECPQGAFLRFFDEIYTNKEGLYLDNNIERLFFQLCDLSVTLYRGLKFLSLQCSAEPSLAGWKDCRLRGVKGNSDRRDTSQGLDTQGLQLCASHLCECIGAKDSSTTCSVPTTAVPMCLNAGATASTSATQCSTPASHTTACSLPLLRYLTDGAFFDSTLTVPSALRKVCLNDSCQEMIYRHMAPRGWQKELLQCAHRDEQKTDSQLEVCDDKVCYSVCHCRNSDRKCCDPLDSNCCSHPCCRAQCSRVMCSTLYGHQLFLVLRNFVGHEHDADPLLQFTRYMVAIAAWPPDSLSGYMTFMLRFSDQLRKEENTVSGSISNEKNSQKNDSNSFVLSSLSSEITLFPGEFDPNCLIGAFLRVTHCDHNNGVAHTALATASALASHSTDTSSSFSPSLCPTSSGVAISILRDCKDCQRLLRPLDYEVYDLYLPMYARRYLTWMLHFGPRLHRGMRALERALKRHIGESSVSQSVQSAACSTDPVASQSGASHSATSVQCHASVLHCPFALPELHSAGLHFWDPNRMCNEKNIISCQCLLQRLQCSLKDSSPLAGFLRQCDSFLWSVRKPFYWLTMALWIIATVYLLFVHLWRLDSWRLLSHVIRSRASHVIYPKVLLAAEHSYERYYAQR